MDPVSNKLRVIVSLEDLKMNKVIPAFVCVILASCSGESGPDAVSMKYMQVSVDLMDQYNKEKFEEIKELMAYQYNSAIWSMGDQAGGYLADLGRQGYKKVKDLELKPSAMEINNNTAELKIYFGESSHACNFQLINDKEWKIKNVRCGG